MSADKPKVTQEAIALETVAPLELSLEYDSTPAPSWKDGLSGRLVLFGVVAIGAYYLADYFGARV